MIFFISSLSHFSFCLQDRSLPVPPPCFFQYLCNCRLITFESFGRLVCTPILCICLFHQLPFKLTFRFLQWHYALEHNPGTVLFHSCSMERFIDILLGDYLSV